MTSKTIITAGLVAVAMTVPLYAGNSLDGLFSDGFEQSPASPWAFYETFDFDPESPSQALLPATMDYVVTHRTHPRNHSPEFPIFVADHNNECAGPVPEAITGNPPPQHLVRTSHQSSGRQPDESFFICKNHMMSSMGEVEGYSVTAFYPRQEFDFSEGGTLIFDVNINDGHPRSWWEIMITPREQLKVGSARSWLPIDETYPRERIVFDFSANSRRAISVGSGELAPDGWQVDENDWRDWRDIDAQDPALADRRQRRTMQIELSESEIRWGVALQDGSMDWYAVALPEGLPFTRGLVLFKTHAYTPEKDDNYDLYTYHWDNIRFSGPQVGRYLSFETEELVYLQANGNRDIGETETATIALPAEAVVLNPILHGQIHSPLLGQVELSINEGPFQVVHPLDYAEAGCLSTGWSSFHLPLDPASVVPGDNTFTWRIGARPGCLEPDHSYVWNGFSVKSLEIQLDVAP